MITVSFIKCYPSFPDFIFRRFHLQDDRFITLLMIVMEQFCAHPAASRMFADRKMFDEMVTGPSAFRDETFDVPIFPETRQAIGLEIQQLPLAFLRPDFTFWKTAFHDGINRFKVLFLQ